MKKDCLFQYAYDDGFHSSMMSCQKIVIVENTELITKEEAEKLWDKYYPDVVEKIEKDKRPQMALYYECGDNADYGEPKKEIDGTDNLEIINGKIYSKLLKEL